MKAISRTLLLTRPAALRRGPGAGGSDPSTDSADPARDGPRGERPEERRRANRIVRQLADLLGLPFGAEVLWAGLLVYARHGDWRIDVYLELEEGDAARPLVPWVLILSRGDERTCRPFPGSGIAAAAEHIRRFVADAQYRQRYLAEAGGSRVSGRVA
jgi:hypothetical protein